MIAFPGLLAHIAQEVGMKVPQDAESYLPEEYVHFHVFLTMQLSAPMPSPDSAWENAKIIAGLTEEECKTATVSTLTSKGVR